MRARWFLWIAVVSLAGIGLLLRSGADWHTAIAQEKSPTPSNAINEIAFTTYRQAGKSSESDIFVTDIDGKNERRLTNTRDNTLGSWSPDGRKIAFTSDRGGRGDVYLMDADGTNVARLTNSPPRTSSGSPLWSPDGKYIAYMFSDYRESENVDIYRMDADGKNALRLTNHPAFDYLVGWSPDSRKIAFLSGRDAPDPYPPLKTYIMDNDGGNAFKLTDVRPANGSGLLLVWAPDGKRIAFTYIGSGPGVAFYIYVIEIETGKTINLTENMQAINMSPSWSPDSRAIAFVSYSRDGASILRIDVEHPEKATVLANKTNVHRYLTWSPNGRYIAFIGEDDTTGTDIHIMNADGSSLRQITFRSDVRMSGEYADLQWRPPPNRTK